MPKKPETLQEARDQLKTLKAKLPEHHGLRAADEPMTLTDAIEMIEEVSAALGKPHPFAKPPVHKPAPVALAPKPALQVPEFSHALEAAQWRVPAEIQTLTRAEFDALPTYQSKNDFMARGGKLAG